MTSSTEGTGATEEPAPVSEHDTTGGTDTPGTTGTDAETRAETNLPAATAPGRFRSLWAALVARVGPATLAFALLTGFFGLVFTVTTPAMWGHDEITQFGRAYQVAHGGFLPTEIEDPRGVAYGGPVPAAIEVLMGYSLNDYTLNPGEPHPMVANPHTYDRLEAAEITSDMRTVWFTNTAAYSAVPYVPAALGIRAAELIGTDVGGMVLLTRLAGLISYLLVVGFALWTLRRYRLQWLVFTVAVLPIAVFQAGTVTADTLTNALAILVSALLVKGLFLGADPNRTEVAALLVTALILPLCKPTYVLLALLIVLIPSSRLGLSGWSRALPWVFATAGAIAFAVWMKIAAPTGEGTSLMRPRHQWYTVHPNEQLRNILGDPLGFLDVFGDSILRRDQEWFTEFFGELGFAYVDVPATSMVTCLLAFAVSTGIAERLSSPDFRRTLLVALTVAAGVAMIYVTLYMSFTPVDYYIIDGVQGRYFVPLAILAFAVLLRWMPFRLTAPGERAPGRGAAIAVIVATTIALLAAAAKYHLIVWG
ncbi:DUF2142 domain-containing protein [Nocardia brevicatena]|uniref:DUF2142 domain-containing protein n=1 Tax=Nocardia brevicatena TaxID=37327 RepID=UPI0002F64123|nr:DUF2142 domain-containing protein [Nocardia brevicatena]